MSADIAMNDTRTGRRIVWALGLSIAVHAALVIAIRAQPGGAPSMGGSWTVHARIESQTPAASAAAPATTDLPEPEQLVSTEPRTKTAADATLEAKPLRDVQVAERRTVAAANDGSAVKPPPQSHGVEMPFVRDPNYYAVAALDAPPRLLGSPEVCYPQGAVGEVAYVLMISERGTVDQVDVASVNPRGLFTGAAVDLCSRLKFTPGVKDGRAVRSRVRFVVGAHPT